MHRWNMMDSLDQAWMALCVWFLRRSPLSPQQSYRLLTRCATTFGLPCPVPVRNR